MIRILMRFAMPPILAALFAAAPVAAQQYPAEPGDGVADLAGIIGPEDADSLRAIVAALRTEAGVEVRVLTVRNIAAYGTNDPSPEAFATAVYNDWKLGYGQRQDGVLVMVSVDDRFARIELGDEVPVHQDARMQDIIDDQMVPHFRQGDYAAGVMAGVRAIARSFRDPYGVMAPRLDDGLGDPQTAYDEPSTGTDSADGVGFVIGIVIGLLVLLLTGAGGTGGTSGTSGTSGSGPSFRPGSRSLWGRGGGGSSRGKPWGGGGRGGSSSGRGASGRW
ncbi:MAG TPA: TPM domain-containing protein [Longimicrobium sp.]|nr:TPM domain-containing protein [Longimicrobium sp.]